MTRARAISLRQYRRATYSQTRAASARLATTASAIAGTIFAPLALTCAGYGESVAAAIYGGFAGMAGIVFVVNANRCHRQAMLLIGIGAKAVGTWAVRDALAEREANVVLEKAA